jgi:predicted HTH transcriptional regulator
LGKQFVPTNDQLWRIDAFEDFLTVRRKLIADAINSYMEKLVAEPEPEPAYTLEDLLAAGESASLEYKSSLRWDVQQHKMNLDLRKMIFKTIAGFLNVEGGTLLIGVADDGSILGVEHDLPYKSRAMNAADKDKFGLLFQSDLLEYLGAEFNPCIHLSLEEQNGHTVAVVKVDPSPKPVYIKDKNHTEFYIRTGNTTKLLNVEAADNHISMHWEL